AGDAAWWVEERKGVMGVRAHNAMSSSTLITCWSAGQKEEEEEEEEDDRSLWRLWERWPEGEGRSLWSFGPFAFAWQTLQRHQCGWPAQGRVCIARTPC